MQRNILKWETIKGNKNIALNNVTGLSIANTGDVAFTFCGQLILPGKRFIVPIYGVPTFIDEQLQFEKGNGNKSATLTYSIIVEIQLTNINDNLCKG